MICPVLDRLKAFGRRTIAYNRQPRRLVVLPIQAIGLALAAYGLSASAPSEAVSLVTVGIVLFSVVFEGAWWLVANLVAGYRSSVPKTK